MALLAAYRVNRIEGETLESYLNEKVFASAMFPLKSRMMRTQPVWTLTPPALWKRWKLKRQLLLQ